MSEENKSTALIKRELDFVEGEIVEVSLAERKRQELTSALERGEVRAVLPALIAVGISMAASFALSAIARVFTPKQPRQRQGEMSGEVQGLMRSEQGILINEIYGADPGDGKGGVKIPATLIWAVRPRKSFQITRQETGGGKSLGGGTRTQETETAVYDIDFAAMGGRGPLLLKREWGNTDKIIDLDKRGVHEGELSSNTFTAPYQISDDRTASDGKEVTLQAVNPATSAVQFNAITSHGAATRDVTIYYVTTGIVAGQVIPNGGTPISVSLPNSSNARSSIIVAVPLNDGTNTIKIRNLSTTLNLRIDRIFCFPGFSETDRSTGILDTTVSPDPNYDHEQPPDPSTGYLLPFSRHNLVPSVDGYGVTTGQTNQGGYGDFAVYPGTDTQLQDPVIEAALDARYGAGSTPAFRNRAFTRHSSFQLTRWASAMPNITQHWENLIYKNLSQIFGQWCGRVNMLTTDYDFSGVETVKCRGLLVSGRRYSPSEVMSETEEIYDIFFTENEGQILAFLHEDAPQITIDESEIGWSEDDEEFTGLDSTLANEIDLPRRVDVKFIDPDREYEPNTQGESRQVTRGEGQVLLEVAITLIQSEARAASTRKLYRDHVRGTAHRFTLSWGFLHVMCGTIINTTKNGIAISMQLTKKSGGISILECEAEDIETAVLTQAGVVDGGVFEVPPVPIPAMSILALLDIPLRDKDETENIGIGVYGAATPRTNSGQVWTSSSLYVNKVRWEGIADFTLPATIGVITDFNITTTDTIGFDREGWIDIEFYHTDTFTPALESVSEDDVRAGANLMAVNTPQGELLIQFATKDLLSPNRYRISDLLYGRRNTERLLPYVAADRRVVLLNEAVQFIPINIAELNIERDYKAATSGQSLDDAATVSFTWTGKSKQTPAPILTVIRDSAIIPSVLFNFRRSVRLGAEIRDYANAPIGEEQTLIILEILDGSTVIQRFEVRPFDSVPNMWQEFWESPVGSKGAHKNFYGGFSLNNSIASPRSRVESYQAIGAPGLFEYEISSDGAGGSFPHYVGLYRDHMPPLPFGMGYVPDYWFNYKSSPSSGVYTIRAEDQSSSEVNVNEGDRVAIRLDGYLAYYYAPYIDERSKPIFVSTRRLSETERFRALAFTEYSILTSPSEAVCASSYLRSPDLRCVYAYDEAVRDGIDPNTLSIRYWQESASVGRGEVVEETV